MTFGLQLGSKFIPDLLNPHPSEIDFPAIAPRLRVMKRFSNNPEALTVHQHRHLVMMIAEQVRLHRPENHTEIMVWCEHHDDHESITGDIPGPLKKLIAVHTHVLTDIENGLDRAICRGMGFQYPSHDIRATVHTYDKMAETIEWVHVLGEPLAGWNEPLTSHITDEFIVRALKMCQAL